MYHFRKSENLITEVKLKIFTVFLLFCWLVYLLAKSPPKTVWKFLVSCRCFSWWETCKTGWQVTQNDAWTYFLDGNDLSKFHLYLFLVGMLGHNLLPFHGAFFLHFVTNLATSSNKTRHSVITITQFLLNDPINLRMLFPPPMGLMMLDVDDFLQDFRSNKQRNTHMNAANTANMSAIAKAHCFLRKLLVVSTVSYKPYSIHGTGIFSQMNG